MAESIQPTISEVEDWVNEFALEKISKVHYSLPITAFRVFLWPGKFTVKLIPGPTARIIMGVMPGHPEFNRALRDSIDRVATQKLYSTMEIEPMAHILQREQHRRAWFKESYGFEWEAIPMSLHDEEITVRRVERIEVIHRATGLREVIEVEQGAGRRTFAGQEIAKTRLARRVRALEMETQKSA